MKYAVELFSQMKYDQFLIDFQSSIEIHGNGSLKIDEYPIEKDHIIYVAHRYLDQLERTWLLQGGIFNRLRSRHKLILFLSRTVLAYFCVLDYVLSQSLFWMVGLGGAHIFVFLFKLSTYWVENSKKETFNPSSPPTKGEKTVSCKGSFEQFHMSSEPCYQEKYEVQLALGALVNLKLQLC